MKAKKSVSESRHRIVVALAMHCEFGQGVLNGILAWLQETGREWQLETFRSSSEFTREALELALSHRTAGVILALPGSQAETLQTLAASDVPLVTIECAPPELEERTAFRTDISIGNAAIGTLAANSLLKLGRLDAFGFVGSTSETRWSSSRETAFRTALDRRRLWCETYSRPENASAVEDRGWLAKWLRHLPKPCGVFASDARRAHDVLQAAAVAKLRVPDDVCIVGVDDERFLCEHTSPTLSSIRPGFNAAGRLAADALSKLIGRQQRNRATGRQALALSEPPVFVARGSTSAENRSGMLVERAMAHIERHAVGRLTPGDVAAALDISRSLLDLRFRQVRHRSVLEEITLRRLKEVKRRLEETDEPVAHITSVCGWTSPNYPKRLFQTRFGCTMSAWRKTHAH